MSDETLTLRRGGSEARIALRGAEPVGWRVDGRELLWGGDPAHWNRSAPILWPVVGASRDGTVRVGGRGYPMPQHGFARDSLFSVVEAGEAEARLRLEDGPGTRARYPYAFWFDVTASLDEDALALAFTVENRGEAPMPYTLGFHPAFPWPFDAPSRDRHRVAFGAPERGEVPLLTPDGLLRRRTRAVPLEGRDLPLAPALFEPGALAFLDAASRSMRFVSPSGAALALEGESWPHLALWTKPAAPFLSMELWTGHADWEDFSGELAERAGMRLLAPGETGRHALRMRWEPSSG